MPIKGQVIYVWEKGTTQMSVTYIPIQALYGDIGLGTLQKVYFELPSSRRYEVCLDCKKFLLDSQGHCMISSNEEVMICLS